MSEKYELIHQDCVEWMNAQKDKSIDCVITSPPYNLNIKYSKYEDNLPREKYIDWLVNISENIKRILKMKITIDIVLAFLNFDTKLILLIIRS